MNTLTKLALGSEQHVLLSQTAGRKAPYPALPDK